MVNIFMIAILPGIAEELIFRGAIQRSFKRMFQNPHVAIWLAAFVFSVIHVQFYGFVPRLLLGAAFGYLCYWGGSLWYAMFAHFLNNAYAVGVAWYLQRNNMPLNEETTATHFDWYVCILSLLATILLIIYFKKQSRNPNIS
jgi:membrane protease YdiL (CAAX protease family)